VSGRSALRLFITAAVVSAQCAPAAAQSHFKFVEPVTPPRAVQVMAHRGLSRLAPENSAAAVLGCGADFIEWAEVDVRLTKDGRHVILHDATLDRTTDGKGPVADAMLEEFLKFDAGSWFAPRFKGTRPRALSELLKAAHGKVNLYLDCKQIDPELLVRDIVDSQMESQVIVYDNAENLKRVRASGKNAIATMTKFRPRTMDFEVFVKEIDPAAVEIDADEVTREICQAFHERGVKVQAKVLGADWDNPATWTKMIEAGVDWLQTDDPVGVRFTEVRRRIGKFPVQIACHRGANRYAPENTIPAIHAAVGLGADYIEIDLRTTKDGRVFLMHDRTVNRTTGGNGPVSDMTAEDVVRLDAGAWFGKPFTGTRVPTLEEALTALGDKSAAYLDAKEVAPEILLAAMREHKLLARSVVYQSPEYLAKLRALEPAVRTLPPLASAGDFGKAAAAKPFGVDAKWSALSRELIARCHAAGIQVFSDALGFNENVDQYRRAIEWGIDVIQTDYPLRVLRAIELQASSRGT
jgi:glycerophosphoryl diester phosphodiesterase